MYQRLFLVGTIAGILSCLGIPASALSIDCYPPEDPITDTEYLEIIGQTRGEEYSRFFDDAQSYLRCLQDEQAIWSAHINNMIRQYQDEISRE